MPEQRQGNENISPTAWTIAHRRTFTDIPYSKEIFEELERLRRLQGVEIPEELKSPEIASQIEARYKLANRLLTENHVEQVLEIAAGFSPRGLEFTDDGSTIYVEVDLPTIIDQKKKIVDTLGQRTNLHLVAGDALDITSLRPALQHFDRSKPLGIIHEGLLRYLTFDQKAVVVKNVHTLLAEFGGIYITPDLTLRSVLEKESAVAGNNIEKVGQLIGINIDQNCFEDVDQAQKFFEDLGFSVERHRFLEVIDELTSPSKLGQTRQQTEALIGDTYVFVMRVTRSEK
jgi:O-methyltransferase involved in polyketide biosynthesis